MFDLSGERMKANLHTFISILLAIFLSFFTPFSELGFNVFFDNMYTESFKRDSCIDLQYASILENDNKFENDTPDYDWSTCFCLTTNYLYEIGIYFLSKKYDSVKQILFSGKASRSPPLI
jgi:hypothetical protein